MNNIRMTLNGSTCGAECLQLRYSSKNDIPWLQVCSKGTYQILRLAIEIPIVALLCLGWYLTPTLSQPASYGLVVVGIELVALGLTLKLPGTVCDITVSRKGVRGDQGGTVPWSEIERVEFVPQTEPSLSPIAWFMGHTGRFNCLKMYRSNGDVYTCQMRNTRASAQFCSSLISYITALLPVGKMSSDPE